MKIFVLSVFLFVSGIVCQAQRFGILAGLNFDGSSIKYQGVGLSQKIGCKVGLYYETNLFAEDLSVNVGLMYRYRESSLSHNLDNTTGISYYFSENFIELPIVFQKTWNQFKFKPLVKAGVYSSYVFSGEIKDNESSESLKYRKGSDKFRNGVVFGAGVYLLPYLRLDADYDLSFSENHLLLGDREISLRDRGCTVSLAYVF